MEAPDKIYVNFPFGEKHPWRGPMVTEQGLNRYDTTYIRKDALIEWLNNEIERYNDKLIQPLNNKEKAIQIASSISSLLVVIAKLETL